MHDSPDEFRNGHGGSQGLGLALAKQLILQGAHVTICSRSIKKLELALKELEKERVNEAQRIRLVSADVSSFAGAQRAMEQCSVTPDIVFCCAGGAKPGLFVEQNEADFEAAVKTDYFTALSTAHVSKENLIQAAARAMLSKRIEGRIVFVSSVVGMMGLVGYAQYSPMKFAIRGMFGNMFLTQGLAETLRSEFQMYGIHVHCFFPATILSPGFEEEQKTKPEITKQIEEGDDAKTPEQCAKCLVRGVQRGNFAITDGLVGRLLKASSSGSAPCSTMDVVLLLPARVCIMNDLFPAGSCSLATSRCRPYGDAEAPKDVTDFP